MAKFPADEIHVWSVQDFIDEYRGLKHLRPRKRGDTVILESGPKDDAIAHARIRRVTSQWWALELPERSGRWSQVPFIRAPLREVLDQLRKEFPWLLKPRE
jgi:hypothetical protein